MPLLMYIKAVFMLFFLWWVPKLMRYDLCMLVWDSSAVGGIWYFQVTTFMHNPLVVKYMFALWTE